MESIRTQLLAMGFQDSKVTRALDSCPEAQTLEQVMEWLIAHEDELNKEQPTNSGTSIGASKTESHNSASTETSQSQTANAEGSSETAAQMATRKKITVEEAQRLITERQAKRLEEERKKEIEDEKRRRIEGQKIAETRAELQDLERIRLAQQIRKEKLEKELHRKQVLDQIARDREAMKARSQQNSLISAPAAAPSATTSSAPSSQPKAAATECKLALRFPDGSNLVHKFSPKEQLAAVRLFVQTERNASGDVEFVAPPNKKLTESNMHETLETLGLCPASRLEVKYKQPCWTETD